MNVHPLLAIILLMAPILLSGGIALRIPVEQGRLRLILAFSAAYLFAISIMHMLPEAFHGDNVKQVGLFIVIGFCSQLIIDTFSTGIEHGHVHLHSKECHSHLPMGIIIGLFLHSLLEGLPVYDLHATRTGNVNYQLILGLAVHNLPITIAFVALLKEHESQKGKRLLLLFLFALMTPVGYLVSYVLQSFGLNDYETYGQLAYAMVIGIFLHISTAILFETSDQHKYNIRKVLVMLSGIIVAYFIS
jgi:zinc and cadmium transporter